MNAHTIHKGICTRCGCDKDTIDYFGWSCSGRSIQHEYHAGTCINCGFSQDVITHFDWPCRFDYRLGRTDTGSHHAQNGTPRDHAHNERREQEQNRAWRYANVEVRYGQLLGLKGKVTKWDIRCAYREQATRYHPDRVAHLAPDIQALATERMKEINQAFDYFRHKYGL